jgi:hypothetical protein
MTLKGDKLTLGNLLGFFDVELGSELIENEALSSRVLGAVNRRW